MKKFTILQLFVLLAFSALQAQNVVSNFTQRVKTRSFPSVFQAWGGILNKPDEDNQVIMPVQKNQISNNFIN